MNLEWFSWSERKSACDKAKEYSKIMRIQFTGVGDKSEAWNMDVANPDGKFFFVTLLQVCFVISGADILPPYVPTALLSADSPS